MKIKKTNKLININFKNDIDYKNRILIKNENPNFKLKAYCINLKQRKQNMTFIRDEWKDYLNIERFIALHTATKSHFQLFRNIWKKKEILNFPIVIIEDDVYRKNNFNKYWNKLLEIKNCDYIPFDTFFLNIKKDQSNCHQDFLSINSHNSMGFNVYYKQFFDKFKSLDELNNIINKYLSGGKAIDMSFCNSTEYVKFIPKEQVCSQIINKWSTTCYRNTNFYYKYYEDTNNLLKKYN